MENKYDSLIIGAGIAGLLTALRLAQNGQRVLVVDKEKVGNGSTLSNHGMLHSGALYVRQHGHIVDNLKEAQEAFTVILSEAEIICDPSIYLSTKQEIDSFTAQLDKHGYRYSNENIFDIPELRQEMAQSLVAISLQERVFSSKEILQKLTSQALLVGVDFSLGEKISKVIITDDRVQGIETALGKKIVADHIIIAAGLGTTPLLSTFSSHYCELLKSRLDMMVFFPKAKLRRGLIFADLDKPILMPAKGNSALGSYFGGIQPQIQGDRKFSVDFDKAKLLVEMTNSYFNNEIVNTQGAQFYMCGKTDFIGNENTEKGFINPGYYVINHAELDHISGLSTIITGKMSLAFHASKIAAEQVLHQDLNLIIQPVTKTGPKFESQIPQMMAVQPWENPERI